MYIGIVVPVFFFVLSRPGGFLDGIVHAQVLYIRLQITEATKSAVRGRGVRLKSLRLGIYHYVV